MTNIEHKNIRKILIIRLSSIGDIILTTECVRLVRNKFPNAEIDYLTSKPFTCLLENNPNIDRVIPYDKTKSKKDILEERDLYLKDNGIDKYDLIIDLHNNFRTRQWSLDKGKRKKIDKFWLEKISMVYLNQLKSLPSIPNRYISVLKKFEIESDGLGLEFWLPGERGKYPPLEKENNNITKIGLAPGAHHFTKRWPIEKFASLISDLLVKYEGAEIKIFGGPEDHKLGESLEAIFKEKVTNHVGKLSLIETATELDKCDLFITNDTGLMHMAAARKIPVVAIFGSTVPELGFAPYGTRSFIVQTDLPCRPCSHIGRDSCPKEHFNCMNNIRSEDVLEGIKETF